MLSTACVYCYYHIYIQVSEVSPLPYDVIHQLADRKPKAINLQSTYFHYLASCGLTLALHTLFTAILSSISLVVRLSKYAFNCLCLLLLPQVSEVSPLPYDVIHQLQQMGNPKPLTCRVFSLFGQLWSDLSTSYPLYCNSFLYMGYL